MGMYINIGNAGFQSARNGEYVDKSGLIAIVNKTLSSERRFSCVSRSRRFGKSMAAKMLCAYYDHSCDSKYLFEDLAIARDPSFERHLNKYPVIYLDLSAFVPRYHDDSIVGHIEAALIKDILAAYPQVQGEAGDDLMVTLFRIHEATGQLFFFIIDEWDAICREFPPGTTAMDKYVGWLRRMFKDVNAGRVFAGVYMTGILPIKKYKTESALNNFLEYSMVEPRQMASFFGFTKEEVRQLAVQHHTDFDELEKWYDGYQIGDQMSMFNPDSVMQAVLFGHNTVYWWGTSAYYKLDDLIQSNFDGVKDELIRMLGGNRYKLNWTKSLGLLSDIRYKDDIFLLLVHLGYLTYNYNERICYFPNREIAQRADNQMFNGCYYDRETKTHSCKIQTN